LIGRHISSPYFAAVRCPETTKAPSDPAGLFVECVSLLRSYRAHAFNAPPLVVVFFVVVGFVARISMAGKIPIFRRM
jgi:hypothetical protein